METFFRYSLENGDILQIFIWKYGTEDPNGSSFLVVLKVAAIHIMQKHSIVLVIIISYVVPAKYFICRFILGFINLTCFNFCTGFYFLFPELF